MKTLDQPCALRPPLDPVRAAFFWRSKAYTLLKVDLDIDSDNTNGADAPDRSSAEEALEDDDEEPGKLIGLNNGDRDFDNIPDYADGFDGKTLSDVNFTQLVLEMPDGIDIDKLKVKLTYSASDPASVSTHQESCGSCDDGGDSSWTTRDGKIYMLPSGNMRIWLKDASEGRNSASVLSDGDFIPPDAEIPFEKLNGDSTERTVTLYVEGIKPSGFPGDDTIKMEMGIDGGSSINYFEVDEVRTTVADVTFKTASGSGFLARDDYIFGAADFTFSASYDDPASLVIFSMKDGESMDLNTLTLPSAPQIMNEVIDYYIGDRTEGSLPLAVTEATPESSSAVNQVVTVDSTGSKGFTYLDAEGGSPSNGSVPMGTAGVVVFEQRNISLGLRSVDLIQSDGPNQTAPVLSVSDADALENFLNNTVYKGANIVWEVELLPTVSTDYDLNNDGDLNLGTIHAGGGERSAVISAGNDADYDYIIYYVHDIPGNGGGAFLRTRYAYLDAGHTGSLLNVDSAHEIGHSLGLPHPFGYNDPTEDQLGEWPFQNDYDPDNVMNYGRGEKLRFNQWIYLNPLSQ